MTEKQDHAPELQEDQESVELYEAVTVEEIHQRREVFSPSKS